MPDQSEASKVRTDLEKRFVTVVVDALVTETDVTQPDLSSRRFGSCALKVHGKIFAMITRSHLVLKLPRDRVNALIQDGTGGPFDAGKGTPMKEWLSVVSDDEEIWLALAREALAFVGQR